MAAVLMRTIFDDYGVNTSSRQIPPCA